ncbi:MAG TPA: glycoside hydrolase family 3 N-terminal domain-containing protein, partial [Bacteroidales bacterium]|nr:glycoside hydrolase family 3 N-terminal domain-containing protein [Bacteroidales bacterium]
MLRRLFLFLWLTLAIYSVQVWANDNWPGLPEVSTLPWQTGFRTHWVDSVLESLTIEQRIAQLIMIEVRPGQDPHFGSQIEQIIRRYNPGGMIFFRGGPVRQVHLTNRFQAAAQTPMLVGMDAEWGPAMRLDSLIAFPHQLTMGAMSSNDLVYQMGMEAGRQLRRLGVHISFSPVVDVNNNPKNPVINFRSFGECRYNVTNKGLAYMRGLQSAGIIASAKHFPGHGDTHQDSHFTLPLLELSRQELDSTHIFPFRQLIREGIHSVMVAHLQIPALESERNLASSLSPKIVNNLLINELEFKGLIVTDALDMQGVSDHFKPGELEVRAFLAGNDILLMPQDISAAVQAIKEAIDRRRISIDDLNQRVRKVLFYKQMMGLANYRPVNPDRLLSDINSRNVHIINNRIAKAATSLIRNQGDIVPIRFSRGQRIAVLSLGAETGNAFQRMIANHGWYSQYSLTKAHTPQQASEILKTLYDYDLVIVGVHRNSNNVARNYGINADNINFLVSLAQQQKVILTLFANPYSLMPFGEDVLYFEAIVVAFQDGIPFEEAAAQVIFGGVGARGRLPVSVPPHFPVHMGYKTPDNFRIQFAFPEEAGVEAHFLNAVDSIVQMAIDSMAFPGSQVAIVKDGLLIYHKAFGYHTYERLQPVQLTDLYDLASITKIAATTAAMMNLVDQDRINLRKRIGYYLKFSGDSSLSRLALRDIMAHQARLQPWIPFFESTILKNGERLPGFYSDTISEAFPVRIAENMYLAASFRDSIFHRVLNTPLQKRRTYVYSDLGFILLADLIKQQSGLPLDEFMQHYFFDPMELATMTFNPLDRFEPTQIVPSQNDTLWRRQVVRGFVNDPAAAML